MSLAAKLATTAALISLLLGLSACKSETPAPETKSATQQEPETAQEAPAAANPGTPLGPVTVPERVRSERNLRPSTFALGWNGTPGPGVASWPEGSNWTHIPLDSEGIPLHLGLSPELVAGPSGATGELLLTVETQEQALAVTSRFALSWSADVPAHARPSSGTLRCPAKLEGYNLERGDTDCFDQQGGGWFSLAVTCPTGKSQTRFYINVNPVLQRGEVALLDPSGAGQVAAVLAEAWSSP